MVSKWVSEIESINVSKVKLVWKHAVWNFISCAEVGIPLMDIGECLRKSLSSFLSKLEAFSAFIEVGFKLIVDLSKLLSFFLGLAVRAIVSMAFREFANICFPAQVLTVDECDGLIRLIVGLVLLMGVESSC